MKEKNNTVLIADCDKESLLKLKSTLSVEGFRVFTVNSAQKILEYIRKRNIDVAIIDVNLTDIEGHKVVPLVKDINNDIKIMLTAKENSPELESKCRQTGIIYYAIKPLDYEEIFDTIKFALKN